MRIHPKGSLKDRAENVIRRRDAMIKYRGKFYCHIGDYGLKSSANSVTKDLKKMGYLAIVSGAYHSDINPALKYGVYARHSAEQIEDLNQQHRRKL